MPKVKDIVPATNTVDGRPHVLTFDSYENAFDWVVHWFAARNKQHPCGRMIYPTFAPEWKPDDGRTVDIVYQPNIDKFRIYFTLDGTHDYAKDAMVTVLSTRFHCRNWVNIGLMRQRARDLTPHARVNG